MSLILMRSKRRLAATVVCAVVLLLAGCGERWQGPVPIDESLWDVELFGCDRVDTNTLLWATGTVTNTGDEESPSYQTASLATYTDGTSGQLNSGTLIPPLEPGQSYEFDFSLLGSADKEIATCEVWVVDAVNNYSR